MLQYEYGFDNGVPVHIGSLAEKDRRDFECPGCGQVLQPVLGKKRDRHFRHKAESSCTVETYLHSVGIRLFKRRYEICLNQGLRFEIEYLNPVFCNYCNHGPCEIKPEKKRFDLTSKFTEIFMTKRDGEFIPDLLLKTATGDKLYIEIAVNHYCSPKKQASGIRIVEIDLQNEKDLKIFKTPFIAESDSRVKFYNFAPKPIMLADPELCTKSYKIFTVYPSGKCHINQGPLYREQEILRNRHWYNKALHDSPEDNLNHSFIKEVENAFFAGIKVKNCWLCRHHEFNSETGGDQPPMHPIFCRYLKKTCSSNQAVECQSYRPDPKVFHYRGK